MLDTKLQIQIREHQTEYDGKLHHGILFSVTEKKKKIKKKILKEARGNKQHTYRGAKIVTTSIFSSEIMLGRG